MSTILKYSSHGVLCIGPTGTSKTVTIKTFLKETSGVSKISVNFTARTSALQTQDIIDAKLEKRRKGVYGPSLGKQCVLFVDDLNMPSKEVYGARPPIELLRQFIDHGGYYGHGDNMFRRIVDMQLIGAMTPRGSVTRRFTRHFTKIFFSPYDEITIRTIYGTMMRSHLEWMPKQNRSFANAVKSAVSATTDVFMIVSSSLLPTPCKVALHF